MGSVSALVKKEFRQVFRDPMMLRLIFVAPILQMILLGYAVNFDVKEIRTALYDHDRSQLSREFVRSFSVGDYFVVERAEVPLTDVEQGFKENRYSAALVIPEDFSEHMEEGRPATVGFWVDGTNANSAGIALGYAGVITQTFNERHAGIARPITMRQKVLYNPEVRSVNYMVPGVVAILISLVTVMLTSMAIVREREAGTLEQVMVTPISVRAFILGKTMPFAILAFVEISVALAVGILWFGIPFVGSWALLYGLAFVFIFTTLGVGMLISTVSTTQQQAMFFAWFFSLFTIMTSGFFTPIANMPRVVQYITLLNPMRYFMKVIRGIMMKGAGVDTLYPEILAMVAFSAVIFTISWVRFSKRIS
jgi:ABC-2 type transport system permease protein